MLRRALSGFLALVFLSVAGLSIAGAGWLWSTFSADSVVSSALGRISGTAASQAVVIGLVVLRSALGRGRKRGSHEAATT